jgi:hypothetical protein
MQAPSDLRHELTALSSFIESIVGGIPLRMGSAAYGPAAETFLNFVVRLSEVCQAYIASWSVADHEEFEDRRGEIEEIRGHWRLLHKLIKPALDADTLQVPSAVVDGIVLRFRDLPGFEKSDFALFHTADFNYVQVHTSQLRTIAQKFRGVIPDAPPFPEDLGLIGMPYSQARTAFANCLVAHEIAHYRYRGTDLESSLNSKLKPELSVVAASQSSLNQPQRDAMVKQALLWAEEIFCDLFAVMLIGPAYSYAYIEAYDLTVILDDDGEVSQDRFLQRLEFYAAHPSHIFRVQQQSKLLRETAWWDPISRGASRPAVLLGRVLDLPLKSHLDQNGLLAPYIQVIDRAVPFIKTLLGRAFDGVDDGFESYRVLGPTIHDYLMNGIVPSILNVPTGDGRDEVLELPVAPMVLLNSGIEFYLTRLNDLIRAISTTDVDSYPRRLHWVRRIEEWIAKAIEDQFLETEVSRDGPLQRENHGASPA